MNSLDHRSLIVGTGPCKMCLITSCYLEVSLGGTPSASSTAKMPNDQISTAYSYPAALRLTSSGAIQQTVPTMDWRLDYFDSSWQLKPKSLSLTSPFELTKMLSLLMSRWIIDFECRKRRPSSTCHRMYLTTFSLYLSL